MQPVFEKWADAVEQLECRCAYLQEIEGRRNAAFNGITEILEGIEPDPSADSLASALHNIEEIITLQMSQK